LALGHWNRTLKQGSTKLTQTFEFSVPEGCMKQVLYWGTTNIRCHCGICHPGDL